MLIFYKAIRACVSKFKKRFLEQFIDYYSVLRVPPRATELEIKKAYRKLAFIYHPDRHSKGEQYLSYFLELQEAYDILSDNASRRKYDEQYVFHFGSLNTHYITNAESIMKEFLHLSHLSTDIDLGGYPKSMVIDYFRYMIQDPHPSILKDQLESQKDWEKLTKYVLDVIKIMHYLDVKDEEEQLLKLFYAEGIIEYETLIAKMKKRYVFSRFKPLLVLVFSAIFMYLMYLFA